MPLSSSSVDRRIPEALSTSRERNLTRVKLGTGKSLFPWRFRSSPAQLRSQQALPLARTSRCRHGPAVDDILCPGDGGGARRCQKRDKVSYLARLCRTAKRNAAKRVHHNLAAAFVV